MPNLHIERLGAHRRVLSLITRHVRILGARHLSAPASSGYVAGLQLRLYLVRRYLQVLADGVLSTRPVMAFLPVGGICISLLPHVLNEALIRLTVSISLALGGRLKRLASMQVFGVDETNIRFKLGVSQPSVVLSHGNLFAPLRLQPLGLYLLEVRSLSLNARISSLHFLLLFLLVLLLRFLRLQLEGLSLRLRHSALLGTIASLIGVFFLLR